jgi:hypothetical protein
MHDHPSSLAEREGGLGMYRKEVQTILALPTDWNNWQALITLSLWVEVLVYILQDA